MAVAVLMGVLSSNVAVFLPCISENLFLVVTLLSPLPPFLLSLILIFLGKPLQLSLYCLLALLINCTAAFSKGFTSY